MTDEEKLAEAWLKARGYVPEFMPSVVVEGRSPDFLAIGSAAPLAVWAEVKTLEPEDVSTVMGRAWEIIHAASLPADLNGHATLYVNSETRDQSVRSLLKLFAEHAPKHRSENVRLVFIQQTPDATGMRRIDFNDGEIPERFWMRGASDKMLGVPPGVLDGFRVATITENGSSRTIEAYKLFDWHAPIDCALVATLNQKDLPLSICPMGGGFVSVAPRVANALESANGQIRNGCRYLQAPGIVLIVPPMYGPVDNQQIAAAAYGRLSFSVDIPSGKFGPLHHGTDATFQSDKNRHISADIRLYRDGRKGMYFPNAFAHRPIDKNSPLLSGLECYPPAAD